MQDNWRKIEGRIEVIWQGLCQVIIDAFKEQGRMTCTEEQHSEGGAGAGDPHELAHGAEV